MKRISQLAQEFDGSHALLGGLGEPVSYIFRILVGVQSGFAGNCSIETKHTTSYEF
jgi:hypothetical protein